MSDNNLTTLLNLDQCKEIVKKFNQQKCNSNLQVKSFNIDAATEAKGFLGEYFHLTIYCFQAINNESAELNRATDDAAILLRFFIKSLPTDANEQNEKVKIFNKESSLYTSLLPKLQKYSVESWCPHAYLCTRNILVLEDLNSQGFYSLATKDSLKDDEMFSVLNCLAAMHASSLLYEFENNDIIGNTYVGVLEEITVHPDIPWFTTGLQAIYQIAKEHTKFETFAAIISELPLHLKNVFVMVNPSNRYRNVLCHRDTWGGNILLNHNNPDKSSAMFVDFQTCRYCPAAIDVIFTLFMNLKKEQRLENQSKYIKYYYHQLVQFTKNYVSSDVPLDEITFSEEDLLASIEEFKLLGYVYRVLALSILKVPKDFVTDYYKNVERSKLLLQYMQENTEFCQLMVEGIQDLIEAVADMYMRV